jgi:hypothetical protein
VAGAAEADPEAVFTASLTVREDVQASAVSDEGGIAGQDTVTVTPASRVMESIVAVACTTPLALGA